MKRERVKLSHDKYQTHPAHLVERPDTHAFRVRCVSGAPVTHPSHASLLIDADGFYRVTITKLTGLVDLVRFWNCPVTFCPPGDTEATAFWCLELEDGLRAPDAQEDE